MQPVDKRKVIDTNVKGVANMLRHLVPLMIESKQGIIFAPYWASKWAIECLTTSVTKELHSGMAIVAFNPGVINMDMLVSCFGSSADLYQTPESWAPKVATMILNLTMADNGAFLTVLIGGSFLAAPRIARFSSSNSNSAYIYLCVSFIQMLKALMPVAVYSIGIIFQKDSFNSSTMANIPSISFGVAIATYGEAKFDSWGILLTSKRITLNPITSLYYFAPCCFVFISVPCLFVEFPSLRDTSSFHFDFAIFGTNSLCALL
ncbi:hypothetical protein ACSBR2_018586 [Camellia fascicularis]